MTGQTAVSARAASMARLAGETFDVVVVGGGIVGGGIARDAALRGLHVALLERRDFGYGTSSRTSKLLHGGLRYLKQGRIGLVLQSLHERDLLRRQEPSLVHPLALAIPVYRGRGLGPLATRFGLWLYGRLARDEELGRGEWLPAERLAAVEPSLGAAGLLGAGKYHDCQVDDARLTLEVVKAAVRAGAVAAPHLEVSGFEKDGGRISAVQARDVLRGTTFAVRGRCFVNAAGPWVDHVRMLDDPSAHRVLRPTKGIHVFVPRDRIRHEHALVLATPDRRIVFVLPWGRFSLVGTTDDDFDGSYDEVAATPSEVAYLLGAVNACLPDANLREEDVVSSYAGLRPLVYEAVRGGSTVKESDISRAHKVFVSPSGLFSIAGGKLTTHRAMAETLVDRLVEVLRGQGREARPCRTRHEPLRTDPVARSDFSAELARRGMPPDVVDHLVDTHLSSEVLPVLDESPALAARLVEGLPWIEAEVVLAARSELACTLEDVLERRTLILHLAPRHGEECADRVEHLLARELDWTDEERRDRRASFATAVERALAFRRSAE